MEFILEFEREDDGRWLAEIPEIPSVLAYRVIPVQAGVKAKALASRVFAERIEEENAQHTALCRLAQAMWRNK